MCQTYHDSELRTTNVEVCEKTSFTPPPKKYPKLKINKPLPTCLSALCSNEPSCEIIHPKMRAAYMFITHFHMSFYKDSFETGAQVYWEMVY